MSQLQISDLQIDQCSIKENSSNGSLQISPIQLNEEYRKKWNETMTDFVVLTKNGEVIKNHSNQAVDFSLYRVGGFGANLKQDYFMLLKYVEAYYPADIMKMSKSKDPKHLEGRWCIIDKNGIEKKEFKPFETPYIVKDSCIYSVDGNYYNIETGKFYCHSSNTMQSDEYLFLENNYDKNILMKGIVRINKKDGIWVVYHPCN